MAEPKRCRRCKRELPPEAFGRNRARADGLQAECRECQRERYLANRERIKEQARENYYANRSARLARASAYRERNRAALLAKSRERHAANRAVRNARRNAAYYANLEAERQKRRDWYWQDPEARRDAARRYYEQYGEQIRWRAREWAKANPERRAAYTEKRRARKLGNGTVHIVDRRVVLQRAEGLCGICGRPVDPDDFHVDHIIPLARGGEESYDNTQPAHPMCNRRKHARLDYVHQEGLFDPADHPQIARQIQLRLEIPGVH